MLHSGDIDGGKGGMADKEAMQLGSRIHRKIQGSMGAVISQVRRTTFRFFPARYLASFTATVDLPLPGLPQTART